MLKFKRAGSKNKHRCPRYIPGNKSEPFMSGSAAAHGVQTGQCFLRNEKVHFTHRTAPSGTTRGSVILYWLLLVLLVPLALKSDRIQRAPRTHARTNGYGNTKTHVACAVFELYIEEGAVVRLLPSVQFYTQTGGDKCTIRACAAGGCRARVQIQRRHRPSYLFTCFFFGGRGGGM